MTERTTENGKGLPDTSRNNAEHLFPRVQIFCHGYIYNTRIKIRHPKFKVSTEN